MLVIGTANRKKGLELAQLFAPARLELRTLADFPEPLEVVEDGDTFAANAALKAVAQARHLGQWVAADDSGLAVDVLHGAPGVFSARYAGPEATDALNNARLLDELRDVPLEQRMARFVCHIVLADPSGAIRGESEASCRGRMLFAPQGTHGFGYDPLFFVPALNRTMAELPPADRLALNHRGRAITALLARLELAHSS